MNETIQKIVELLLPYDVFDISEEQKHKIYFKRKDLENLLNKFAMQIKTDIREERQ